MGGASAGGHLNAGRERPITSSNGDLRTGHESREGCARRRLVASDAPRRPRAPRAPGHVHGVDAAPERDAVAERCPGPFSRCSTTASWSARRCSASSRRTAPQRADGVDDDGHRARALRRRQHLLAVGAVRPRRSPVSLCWPTRSGSGSCPAFYVGVVLLVRERMPHLDSRLWLDGIVAALTTGAISAALVFGALQVSTGGDTAAVATNLAYPLGDMILLGQRHRRHGRRPQPPGPQLAVVRRRDRRLCGLRLHLPPADRQGHLRRRHAARHRLARGRAAGGHRRLAAVACACGPPATSCRASSRRSCSRWPASRCSSTTTSTPINLLAVALSARRWSAVLIRLSLTHRESRSNLVTHARAGAHRLAHRARQPLRPRSARSSEALGDPAPHVLLLFDLDGFKNYNDSYGHPAGDALLARLGSRLAAATAADGTAYRVGGDEFCVLAAWPADQAPDAAGRDARAPRCASRARASRSAPRPATRCSPATPRDADEAMRVADRRLYAEKHSGRMSARLQSAGVLRSALSEWDRRAGRAHQRRRGTRRAGRAAPRSRRGRHRARRDRRRPARHRQDRHPPLDPAQARPPRCRGVGLHAPPHAHRRAHRRRAPPRSSASPGSIRSSHERWDGNGYPDQLAGDDIPLGSQIVLVCDAYAAMTTERCYKPAMTHGSRAGGAARQRRHPVRARRRRRLPRPAPAVPLTAPVFRLAVSA